MLLFFIHTVQYFWALFLFTARIKSLFIHFSYSLMIAKVTSFLIFFYFDKNKTWLWFKPYSVFIHIHLVLPCCLCILCTIWASSFWLVAVKSNKVRMEYTLKPPYNESRYSEFCDIVNKIQLPFWGFTKHITFDIVNYLI